MSSDEPPLFGKGATADNYETGKSRARLPGPETYANQALGRPSAEALPLSSHLRLNRKVSRLYSPALTQLMLGHVIIAILIIAFI